MLVHNAEPAAGGYPNGASGQRQGNSRDSEQLNVILAPDSARLDQPKLEMRYQL
jgi:hypothetical protein